LLLSHVFELQKPLFAICFGLQSLNVWRGGTLIQHLPTMTSVNHDPGPAILSAHAIDVVPTSKLAAVIAGSSPLDDLVSITNTSALVVNSSHHQAIDHPGKGLVISARCSEDGVIEAIDGVEDGHFVLGVQWHPERSYDSSALSRGLFRAFVHAAEAWHTRVPLETLAL